MNPMSEPQSISVLLADDHPLMRKGLKEMIEDDPSFSVVAEAGNGERALALIELHKPAVAVLDIDMPVMSGLEVAAAVQKKKLPTRIIFLTMYDTENIFTTAIERGVMGYVLKESAAAEIVDALKSVSAGKHFITPALSGVLVKRSMQSNPQSDAVAAVSQLTVTERKIVALIAQDRSTKDIAEMLFVSPRTVETHRNNICQKFNLHGANALYKFALENKHLL